MMLAVIRSYLQVGEIWINSASKACGYWGHPEVSLQEFHAIPSAENKEVAVEADGADAANAAFSTSCEPVCNDISAAVDVAARGEGYLRTGMCFELHCVIS